MYAINVNGLKGGDEAGVRGAQKYCAYVARFFRCYGRPPRGGVD